MNWPFTVEGQSPKGAERNPLLNFETVTPDYFRVMGIPLRYGRAFDERDRDGQPGVVVVSEALAGRYWPGQDPIGKRLKIPLPPTEYHDTWLTVVGVAGDAPLPRAAGHPPRPLHAAPSVGPPATPPGPSDPASSPSRCSASF
jgi:putative ABC transport system permease protein